MEKRDFKEFLRLMAVLQETFTPEKPVSEQKAEIYFNAFADLSVEQFRDASSKIIQTKKFPTFPLPSELREALYGNTEDVALLAFEVFRRGGEECGDWASAVFDDPLIHATVQHLGGWSAVCTKTKDEWVWMKKDFVAIYQVFLRNGVDVEKIPKVLFCSYDAQSMANGFKDPSLKIFGDKRKAIEWSQQEVEDK